MKYPVDLGLFEGTAHSPSFLNLQRSMGRPDLALRDYCIPVNPYFPTPALFAEFRRQLDSVLKYYPSSNETLSHLLASILELDAATLVLANGSTELITWVDRLLVAESIATPVPTFGRWTDQPAETGKRIWLYETRQEDDFGIDVDRFVAYACKTRARAVALCNPNNPTGALVPRREMVRLLDALADLDLVVIDESFIDFSDVDEIPTVAAEAAVRPNVVVLKSLGKNFGLHGVRFGYAVAHPEVTGVIRKALPKWNVNAVAEMVIRALPEHWDEYEESRRRVIRDEQALDEALRSIEGLRVFPSRANFSYVRMPDDVDGVRLRNHILTEHGCFVRECGNKLGSDSRDFRIAARPVGELTYLMEALRASLDDLRGSRVEPVRSAAGYSLIGSHS